MNRGWKILNSPIPRRYFYFSAGVLVVFILGYRTGTSVRDEKWSNVIAMQRVYFSYLKHPKYKNQPIPRMASIVLDKATNGFRTSLTVETTYPDDGIGSREWFLGFSSTPAEAIEKWGDVDWKDDGIYAGKVLNQLIVKRNELEGGGR